MIRGRSLQVATRSPSVYTLNTPAGPESFVPAKSSRLSFRSCSKPDNVRHMALLDISAYHTDLMTACRIKAVASKENRDVSQLAISILCLAVRPDIRDQTIASFEGFEARRHDCLAMLAHKVTSIQQPRAIQGMLNCSASLLLLALSARTASTKIDRLTAISGIA